jgi:hypothetical protein
VLRSAILIAASAIALMQPRVKPCAAGAPVAFRNVRVLTMDSPTLTRQRVVLVNNGKIVAIGNAQIPSNACVIDGNDRVLMPGLSDMHVHTDESELPLFIANGVTLIREMNGSPTHLDLKKRLAAGQLLGPRMLVASPLLAGVKQRYRHRLITSGAEAAAAANEFKTAGYDYLKVYDGLSLEAYDSLVAAGRRLGIPLDGHIPKDVGLERVLNAGQHIQHLDKIVYSLIGNDSDSAKLARLTRLFNGRREWVTPTLASLRALGIAGTVDYAARLASPEMKYVDSATMGFWSSLSGTKPSHGAGTFYGYDLAVLATLRKTDARLLLGTDEGNPLMVAGFSVHDELEALVRDAGFSPYDALLTSTRNVGEFLGDPTTGRIARGARADLILVDGNPLEDITVLRHPSGVMEAGRWLDRAALDSLKVSRR